MTLLGSFFNACFILGQLKTVYTIGNCQRPVFSLNVSQRIKIQTCENLSSIIGLRSCEIIMKEKKTFVTRSCVLSYMLDFETSNSKSEFSKSNSSKITPFTKTASLQRESLLTLFYNIKFSSLLNT